MCVKERARRREGGRERKKEQNIKKKEKDRGVTEMNESGDPGAEVETNKTLVKVLALDPWRHVVSYLGSQRVLFLNELKSHLPLSCSIHQATSRESLT